MIRTLPPILVFFFLNASYLGAQPAGSIAGDTPPRASLIQVSEPDANFRVTFTGAAGAAPSNSTVMLITLETGHFAKVQAAENGSFTGSVFAPQGTSALVKVTTRDACVPGGAGTIIRVPERNASEPGVPFAGAGPVDFIRPEHRTAATWMVEGSVNAAAFQPGETLRANGTLRIVSPLVQAGSRIRITARLGLARLSGPSGAGAGVSRINAFSSTLLTPTGLPIEGLPHSRGGPYSESVMEVVAQQDGVSATIRLSLTLRSDLLEGFYRPFITLHFAGVPSGPPSQDLMQVGTIQNIQNGLYLPVIRLGDPASPRQFWTLMVDTLSNGSRGVGAIEDRADFRMAQRLIDSIRLHHCSANGPRYRSSICRHGRRARYAL